MYNYMIVQIIYSLGWIAQCRKRAVDVRARCALSPAISPSFVANDGWLAA